MSFNIKARPAASDESMFGCECAMPFLTLLYPDALGRRTLSGLALGAAVTLGACDAASPAPLEAAPQDKVSQAFSKVDREIARAKARWGRDAAVARQGAVAGSAPGH
jgi:hypothetical protein